MLPEILWNIFWSFLIQGGAVQFSFALYVTCKLDTADNSVIFMDIIQLCCSDLAVT